MGTQRVQLTGALPRLVRLAYRAITRDLLLLGPVQNNLFLTVHYFNSFVPIVQQAGQAAMLGRLSLIMCLWS